MKLVLSILFLCSSLSLSAFETCEPGGMRSLIESHTGNTKLGSCLVSVHSVPVRYLDDMLNWRRSEKLSVFVRYEKPIPEAISSFYGISLILDKPCTDEFEINPFESHFSRKIVEGDIPKYEFLDVSISETGKLSHISVGKINLETGEDEELMNCEFDPYEVD